MDDLGTIIYIVFLLISLLGGVWRNLQKRKAEKQEPVVQSRPVPSTRPDPVSPAIDLEMIEELKREERAELEKAKDRLNVMRAEAAEARAARKRAILQVEEPSIIQLEEIGDERDSIAKDFDLKKAIIYSEIINPPYL